MSEIAKPCWKRVKTPLGTVKMQRVFTAETPERVNRKKNRNKGSRRQRTAYPDATARRERGTRSDGAVVILGGCVSRKIAYNKYYRPPVDKKKAERLEKLGR